MPEIYPFDTTDVEILRALQRDGRLPFVELARIVSMSPSAVKERVRRLEEAGVIAGYSAVVDTEKLGYTVFAHIRLRYPSGNFRALDQLLDSTSEILEAHHVTGEDCFILKVAATSMRHLEQLAGRVAALGPVTTSVVYSTPLERRAVLPPGSKP